MRRKLSILLSGPFDPDRLEQILSALPGVEFAVACARLESAYVVFDDTLVDQKKLLETARAASTVQD